LNVRFATWRLIDSVAITLSNRNLILPILRENIIFAHLIRLISSSRFLHRRLVLGHIVLWKNVILLNLLLLFLIRLLLDLLIWDNVVLIAFHFLLVLVLDIILLNNLRILVASDSFFFFDFTFFQCPL